MMFETIEVPIYVSEDEMGEDTSETIDNVNKKNMTRNKQRNWVE